jgi:hypothetical protein
VIIWGGSPPAPEPGSLVRRQSDWWESYAQFIGDEVRKSELLSSSIDIVGAIPDPMNWGQSDTPFKGLIVGAVQSGKTASMIGVASVAIDQGYKVVIVLAGMKDDLRRQTARRFNTQLLGQVDPIPESGGSTTGAGGVGPGPLGGFALPYFYDANFVNGIQFQIERALRAGEPSVLVIKKSPASLQTVAAALHVICKRHGVDNVPTLILDDECDEASVPAAGEDKTIPLAISNLWKIGPDSLNVAYIGYTATAAASLLQAPDAELFPSHFVHLLRYPAANTTALTYAYPHSDGWYSGGNTYYDEFGGEAGEGSNFLISPSIELTDLTSSPPGGDSLKQALIAYIVGGTFRYLLQADRSFSDPDSLPESHSMMVQTSLSLDHHRLWRDSISEMLHGFETTDGAIQFDQDAVLEDIAQDPADWISWWEHFENSRSRVVESRPHSSVSGAVTWQQVITTLPEIISNIKLRLVNSDLEGGQTLDYSSGIDSNGATTAPRDVYVIAVGGAKLSRGLTLEGLCVSYYTRSEITPYEDVTLQTSRWYGYRGSHLEFCRVFTTEDSYHRLSDIHLNDLDHRARIADLMDQRSNIESARLSLRTSPSGLLTAKTGVGVTHNLAFSPFNHVFSDIDTQEFVETNENSALELVDRLSAMNSNEVVSTLGTVRGSLSYGWGPTQIADLLDSFQYTGHNPDPSSYPHPEFYRPAESSRPINRKFDTNSDPYVLAAYLRYWESTGRHVPRFNVGITYGSIGDNTAPFDFPLLNRKISSSGKVEGGWSGSSAGWDGDITFDLSDRSRLSQANFRINGTPGLLLLHVVHMSARGRLGVGIQRDHHSPFLGVSVPAGGPDLSVVVNFQL